MQNNLPTTEAYGYQMPAEYAGSTNEVIKSLGLNVEAPVLFNHIYQMLSNNGKDAKNVSQMDVFTFLVNCKQLNLNPLAKQIYGFVSKGKVVNIISIEGFTEIANRNPNYDGVDFEFGPLVEKELTYSKNDYFNGQKNTKLVTVKRNVADWIKCIIYRKDRNHPVSVTTFFDESNTGTEPWATKPMQMLQNRAFANSVKKAFSINGYLEKEEFMDDVPYPVFVESGNVPPAPVLPCKPDAVEAEFVESTEPPSILAQAGFDMSAPAPVEVAEPVVGDVAVATVSPKEENTAPAPQKEENLPLPPLPDSLQKADVAPAEPVKKTRRKKTVTPIPQESEVTPDDLSRLTDAGRSLSGRILNTHDIEDLKTLGLQIATMGLPKEDTDVLRKLYVRQQKFLNK
jgi:phage recombination protein Bet